MFFGEIELTKFINVDVRDEEVYGEIKRCIIIPCDDNGFVVTRKKKVMMFFLCREETKKKSIYSHRISGYVGSPIAKEKKGMGELLQRIEDIGKMKIVNWLYARKLRDRTAIDDAMDIEL